MQNHFSLQTRRDDETAVLVAAGELDLASAPDLEAGLDRAWASGAERVVLDLRDITFMDSTGLHAVLRAHRHAQQHARDFGVIDGGDQVHKLLRLTGALDALHLIATPDAAVGC